MGATSRSSRTVVHTELAGSGDLAIVIGGCASAGKARGSFVRVWKRHVTGRWRIVFQTES